jgi:peptide/nickel transport system substrate-binding protein
MSVDPQEIVGLGPFRIAEIQRTGIPFISEQISTLVLERNPFYWKRDAQGTPLPRLDRIIWRGGQQNILGRFKEGEIDLFEPNTEEAGSLPAGAQLVRGGPQNYFFMLLINQDATDPEKRALFRDPLFRQALAYATERSAFVQQFPGGFAVPRESFLHPLSPHFDEASQTRYPFDLSEAAALLDQLGLKDTDGDGWRDLPNGQAFTLEFLLHRDDPVRIEVAKIYQENLSRVGLKVELEITSLGDWRGRLFTRPPRYEVAMATFTVDIFEVPSIVLQLTGLFSSQGEFHLYRPSDASGRELTEVQREIDQILTTLPTAPDADPLFARLQQLIAESVPIIPLYSPEYLVAVQPNVKGAEAINAYGYVRFLELLDAD